MELLFTPDLAYLLLVIGFLIGIMALVTPGTGVLELVAFTLLAAAGWIVSKLNFNWIAVVILAVGVVPFLFALRKTNQLVYLIISMIALSVGSTFLFTDNGLKPVVHPALAVIVNILVVGFFWVVVRKSLDAIASKPRHNYEALTGSTGMTRTEVFHEGSVYAHGEMWTAFSDHPIPANRKVKIISKQGFSLEVTDQDQK